MNLYDGTLILNLASTFLEAITHSSWPDAPVSSFVPQHDRALFFLTPSFLSLCPTPSSLLHLVKLTWIIFWSRFYKCLMNLLQDNNSVDLVSINVRFSAAPLTGMNEPSDAAEEWKGWLAQRVPLRPPKTNCCEGQLALQCLSWIILWVIRLYWISIALHIPRHTMPLRKCLYMSPTAYLLRESFIPELSFEESFSTLSRSLYHEIHHPCSEKKGKS